jgi:acylpyruvate hydrolase
VRLATIRRGLETHAVRFDGDDAVDIGVPDIGALLARPDWRDFAAAQHGDRFASDDLDFAPVIPSPEKIICVGLNYRTHILEMGREMPEYPTLFAKYPRALVGAFDDVVLPQVSAAVDWEAELGVVVGRSVRHASVAQARAAIAGYTVVNDVTIRDWQYRTSQWMQGKNFESTTPMGPYLVTDADDSEGFSLTCEVNGEIVQSANTNDLVFDPATLVAYISTMLTLSPGDIIATGTPGGVGHARIPPHYLADGAVLTTRIAGVGECRNVCRDETK